MEEFPARAGMMTVIGRLARRGNQEFPARAGMNRTTDSVGTLLERVPRTRGDEPSWVAAPSSEGLSSPHARG